MQGERLLPDALAPLADAAGDDRIQRLAGRQTFHDASVLA